MSEHNRARAETDWVVPQRVRVYRNGVWMRNDLRHKNKAPHPEEAGFVREDVMAEAVAAAVQAEREACAAMLDALAKEQRENALRENSAFEKRLCGAYASALEVGAQDIRAGKKKT